MYSSTNKQLFDTFKFNDEMLTKYEEIRCKPYNEKTELTDSAFAELSATYYEMYQCFQKFTSIANKLIEWNTHKLHPYYSITDGDGKTFSYFKRSLLKEFHRLFIEYAKQYDEHVKSTAENRSKKYINPLNDLMLFIIDGLPRWSASCYSCTFEAHK